MRQVCEKLGQEMCEVLPSLNVITKGKKKAFDIVRLYPSLRQIVGSLGERVPASDEDLNKIEQFVCALYNDHRCNSVNELRYKLFCKSKNQQSHQLPPTKAALKSHLRRANYQALLWKNPLETQMNQAPDGHGWQLNDGQVEIYWSKQAPAHDSACLLWLQRITQLM